MGDSMIHQECDVIPVCDIWIDKEGTWYFRGAEMFRREIVNLFYQNLVKDPFGRYMIVLEDDQCFLEVEDVPFVVRSVHLDCDIPGDHAIILHLCDEKMEKLDLSTLRIRDGNVLYCAVRNRQFEARFSRAAYYQFTQHVEYDPISDEYYIALNGHRHILIKGGPSC